MHVPVIGMSDRSGRCTASSCRRFAVGSLALGALWAVSFVTSMRRPVVRSDEAWFLWVAVRANSGASLYRGVYYVTTPLAMWLMQGLVWIFGVHFWVDAGWPPRALRPRLGWCG